MKVKSEQYFDFSGLEEFEKKLRKMDEYEVEYGYYDHQSHPETEISLADIVAIHEEGSKFHPARHLMNKSGIRFEQVMDRDLSLTNYLYKEIPLKSALDKVGNKGKKVIKDTIELNILTPPNSESTIAKKGHDTVMKESGYLAKHAIHKVQKRSGDD